jgi:AraC-like DNA-binding protein
MEHFPLTEYRPFQSMSETVRKCDRIHCREYIPCKYLQPYISCYWIMTSEIELEEPILHRVIPDGCIDIIFDLNEHSYRKSSSIVGTMTKPIFAELKGPVNYVAIRFLPGGFLHFFNSPAHDLTDRIIPLEMISARKGGNLTEKLILENHIGNKIKLLENFLENLLMTNSRSDPIVKYALHNILKNKGNIRVSEISKNVNSNQRQLRRKFDKWVGISPKAFCRIIRFQTILRMLPRHSKCNLLSIALDGGYYDQSHFIHEFNSCCGLNPSEFLKSRIF